MVHDVDKLFIKSKNVQIMSFHEIGGKPVGLGSDSNMYIWLTQYGCWVLYAQDGVQAAKDHNILS